MTARDSISRSARVAVAMLVAAFFAGCAAAPPPRVFGATPGRIVGPMSGGVDHLEERALLLLISDRRTFEGVTIGAALKASPELRRQAALALGRIGDVRGVVVLQRLLADADLPVRRTAAFALGELAEKLAAEGQAIESSAAALLGSVNDDDRQTGLLAVEALAKLGVTVETVVERLIEADADELLPRLLPSLFRFQSRDDPRRAVVRWGLEGLQQDDARLHALAAYALARAPMPEGVPALRQLLGDADPWVRGWAARALGEIGDRSDVDRLVALFDDGEAGPIIQALRALRRLIDAGRAAAPYAARPRLLELLDDPRPGVRVTAIEVSTVWLLDDEIGERLERYALEGRPRERILALGALARGDDPRALALLTAAAGDREPAVRRAAARAAGLQGAVEVLDRLADDPYAAVRAEALTTWLVAEPPDAAERVSRALADADAGVRASAFEWLAEHPVAALDTLRAALERSKRDRLLDARLAAIDAIAARAEVTPLERGALMNVLEELSSDDELLVRRRAAVELAELGGEPEDPGGLRLRKPVSVYREIVRRTSRPILLDVHTDRGTLRLELACREAPLTCLNFLQLGTQGFYDGLAFHRVVPDFVVQAGDPRGDGRGGPGYTIRDEINLLRYDRGAVGMALSGPDTGGSQFFVTLTPQPHLDGGYTVFGRVVAGLEVLDEILAGDRISRIVEVAAP